MPRLNTIAAWCKIIFRTKIIFVYTLQERFNGQLKSALSQFSVKKMSKPLRISNLLNLLEGLENLKQQLLYLLIIVISVLASFKEHWMDARDLSAKLQLAQIDTGVEIRME